MYILAPSLLAADFTKLGEQIKETERCGAQFLHIDVMDGIFVPSISFGMPLIESIRPATKQFFDVHLMIVRAGALHSGICGLRSRWDYLSSRSHEEPAEGD